MALVHHELCFGCGRTNLFGLLLEVEPTGEGTVAGRCFLKQDHQGPRPGLAHEGILAAALLDAMAFACGEHVYLRSLNLLMEAETVPVAQFVEVEARVEHRDGDDFQVTARAKTGSDYVCSASGSLRLWPST